MPDQTVDLYDLEPRMSDLVSQCEITGTRTRISRDGRVIAILITADEHLALTQTIEIASSPETMAAIEEARREAAAGNLLEPEDLFVE